MNNCGCNKIGLTVCEIVGIVLGIIAGVAAGIVFSIGLIPSTISFVIVALITSGVALLVLLDLLIAANNMKGYNGFNKCICKSGRFLLTGAIGTLLAGTLAIATGFTITAIASIVFVALTAFFFVLLIVALICLLSCVIKESCRCRDEIM